MIAWLLSLRLVVVVDRIEPPMAVLEWPSGALCDAPLSLLPTTVREGQQLSIAILPSRSGSLAAGQPPFLMTPQGLLGVPVSAVQPGRRYAISFHMPQPPSPTLKERLDHVMLILSP